MARNPEFESHQQWIAYIQPVGLLVSPPALVAAQAFGAVRFIAFYPKSIPVVFALGIAYGIGYGLYFAVDWALACDTLPDKTKSAKDMGLFHIALTLPQALLPLFGGALIDYLNHNMGGNAGYRVVFSSAVVFLFLGTVLVSRIKSVR